MHLAAIFILALAAPPAGEATRDMAVVTAPPDILVTAPKDDGEEATPLGSRIARQREERGYQQMASDSGVAGLTPGSGMDPFAGPTKRIQIRTCKSSDPDVGEAAACALAAASAHMEKGEWEAARTILYRLGDDPATTAVESYVAARFFYRIALAEQDGLARMEALVQMLATGMMTGDEAVAARKTLIALALRGEDEPAAIRHLEALLRAHPDDSRSQANLATLYARAGSHDKALPHMEKAIALIERAGGTPPKGWTDYVRAHPR